MDPAVKPLWSCREPRWRHFAVDLSVLIAWPCWPSASMRYWCEVVWGGWILRCRERERQVNRDVENCILIAFWYFALSCLGVTVGHPSVPYHRLKSSGNLFPIIEGKCGAEKSVCGLSTLPSIRCNRQCPRLLVAVETIGQQRRRKTVKEKVYLLESLNRHSRSFIWRSSSCVVACTAPILSSSKSNLSNKASYRESESGDRVSDVMESENEKKKDRESVS